MNNIPKSLCRSADKVNPEVMTGANLKFIIESMGIFR
jgi:hypothetical protein